ncbi:MAG TPA: type II secretion system minor pseudopilin GspI [Rhodanobacter sp.]
MAISRPADDLGFTLLEVLIALTIVSLALLAALRVAGQGAMHAEDLRARVMAGWVAENRLAEHHARLGWPPLGQHVGTQRQGQLDLVWHEDVTATPNPAFRRVDVWVAVPAAPSHVLARVTGFVASTPRSTP